MSLRTHNQDDYMATRMGNFGNRSIIHKMGQCVNVADTSYRHLWTTPDSDRVWMQAAENLTIKSDSINDAFASGSGAWMIRIFGIVDNDGAGNLNVESFEDVQLNGITDVVTTKKFLRHNFSVVGICGTYGGTNSGTITIKDLAGNIQGCILPGHGYSKQTHYSLGSGQKACLLEMLGSVQGSPISMRFNYRSAYDVTANDLVSNPPKFVSPAIQFFDVMDFIGTADFAPKAPVKTFPPMTDIWVSVKAQLPPGTNPNTINAGYGLYVQSI